MRNNKILIFCIMIFFLTLTINSIFNYTNAVYPTIETTNYITASISQSTEVYPEGADVINKTLEDQDSISESYEVTRLDCIQVYFMIDKSSIDLILFFHGEEYEVKFEGLSPITSAYNNTFAFTKSGRVQVAFYNPGLVTGKDSIQVIGYMRLIANGAQKADLVISVPDYAPSIEGWIVVIVATFMVYARKHNIKHR